MTSLLCAKKQKQNNTQQVARPVSKMLTQRSMPRCHLLRARSLASKLRASRVSSRASCRFRGGQSQSSTGLFPPPSTTYRLSRCPLAGPAWLAFAPGPTCFTAKVVRESVLLVELVGTHAASSTARPPSLGSTTTTTDPCPPPGPPKTVYALRSMSDHRLRCDHTFFFFFFLQLYK